MSKVCGHMFRSVFVARNPPVKVRLSGQANNKSVGALFEKWRREFETNSISEPRESIEHILARCLGTTQISDVYKQKNAVLPPGTVSQIGSLCRQRLQHVPIQYLLGEWSFRKLTLKMAPPVFIPRPETEQLVDIVLQEMAQKECRNIADLCCGSGAIGLSLLQEDNSIKVIAVDQSMEACRLTKENAQKNGLNKRIRIIQSQVDQWKWDEKFDMVVSNPPYIFEADLKNLQPEIKLYEDLEALNGGADGLNVIKLILEISSRCLNENGKLFLEVEPRHPALIKTYLESNPLRLSYVTTHRDFFGKDRFVEIIKTI